MTSSTKPILIFGDSLSFPRARHNQLLQDTWPSLVANSLKTYCWNQAIPGATSKEVKERFEAVKDFFVVGDLRQFSLIVFQIGIVDATPRTYPWALELLFRRLPNHGGALRRAFIRLFSITGRQSKTWTSRESFAFLVRRLADMAIQIADAVVFVQTAPAFHRLKLEVPGVDASVEEFRTILRNSVEEFVTETNSAVRVVDPFSTASGEWFLGDGHHLSEAGHMAVARAILEIQT